ncbi:uncharacterized protein LOC127081647 [Lathyrus oleraceus]|uniref:uncharacterized protein LOC127081647 n=1 Tax=Pisum sativum TaxID=3888 RepID=UPI0021CE2AF9|nr:uncharacterized protein LOC127081647 [Pisum sativum]
MIANDLAQIASGYKISKEKLHKVIEVGGKVVVTKLVPLDLEKIKLGCVDEGNFEILEIDSLTDEDWRKPIVVYLQSPTVSTDRKTRFGIPETIITDQGSIFTGRKMQEFAKDMGFKLLMSTPYYAQASGQVEAANKVIIGLIKKHVGKEPRNWRKTLDQILWACRTSPKEATQSIPFRLTFGHDVVLLVEIHLQSLRFQRQHELPMESYWSMMLDELFDLDEERLNALELLRQQKKRIEVSYNKKMKVKSFTPGDLVWKVILQMDRKDRALGKWSQKWEDPFQIPQIFSNGAYEIEELSEDRRILRVNGKYLKKYKPTIEEVKIRDG